jgi:hypothetical protein
MNLSDGREPIDYRQLLELLARGSALDLYRLSIGINHLLDEPQRIIAVKRQLRQGQTIEYFNESENRFISARLIELLRTQVSVEHLDDRQRWTIPYYAIRLPQQETLTVPGRETLDRHSIQIGDAVGFVDKHGREHYGTVVRLNQKTVSLDCGKDNKWRVAYSLLFPVIDAEKARSNTGLQRS